MKIGSIATPEPVQAGSFTPEATGGTAPMKAASLVGDAEAYRVTSKTKAKSTTFTYSLSETPGSVNVYLSLWAQKYKATRTK